jgi:hypothetical protein
MNALESETPGVTSAKGRRRTDKPLMVITLLQFYSYG